MKMKPFLLLAMLSTTALAGDGTSLSGTLIVAPQWAYVKTQGVSVVTASFPNQLLRATIANGTNDNQMTQFAVVSGTVAGSSSNVYNLETATNAFGEAFSFDKANFFAAQASASNVDDIAIYAHPNDEWTSMFNGGYGTNTGVTLRSGGTILFHAPIKSGYMVGDDVGSAIILQNMGTNAASYDIYIGGIEGP